MGIEFVRIDDRLVHGQVLTTWTKNLKIEQILIINDEVSKDETQKNVFKMTAPNNINLRTFSVEKFSDIYNNQNIKRRTLILLTNPIDAYRLAENGVDIPVLNVGGMKFTDERKQYTRAVSLSKEEKEVLVKLNDSGTEIFIQMVSSDERIEFDKIMKEGD